MSTFHGQFCWCELMTTDTAAATEFYNRVIGWTAKDSGVPGMQYTVLSAGETGVGGLMELPEPVRAAGGRPGWSLYIAVDDVDAMVTRIQAAGGGVHRAPEDIPGIGRFAVVHDLQGAIFCLIKPMTGEEAPPSVASMTTGHVGWHELHCGDLEAAFAFYAGLFGWTKDQAIDMGPMGTYQLFSTGGTAVGGMMKRIDAMPVPFWLDYFNVNDINAAVARAKEAGGQLLNGPHEVPGGSWIAQCLDPQGAMFAMVQPGVAPAR
jgi:predicted enzyme related to lactoylglutathione lyase